MGNLGLTEGQQEEDIVALLRTSSDGWKRRGAEARSARPPPPHRGTVRKGNVGHDQRVRRVACGPGRGAPRSPAGFPGAPLAPR